MASYDLPFADWRFRRNLVGNLFAADTDHLERPAHIQASRFAWTSGAVVRVFYHCHFVVHSDFGTMAIIRVLPGRAVSEPLQNFTCLGPGPFHGSSGTPAVPLSYALGAATARGGMAPICCISPRLSA